MNLSFSISHDDDVAEHFININKFYISYFASTSEVSYYFKFFTYS